MTDRRTTRLGGDAGSLPLAMLLTLVGVTLSALLVPMVITQVGSTRHVADRVHALHAAQAGLDVALGHIRAAADITGSGRLARLPCGPLTGRVGAAGTARYEVTVQYFGDDPQGKSEAWKTANAIPCVQGGGALRTPRFALLHSLGTDRASGAIVAVPHRTLEGTYPVRTTNQNISGGLIRVYRTATGLDLCLDAGSASPATGTELLVQLCSAGSTRQTFAYRNDLSIQLVASPRTAAAPDGMCIDADTPHATGRVVRLRPCGSPAPARQMWSYNDYQDFEGTTDGEDLDDFCLNVQFPNTAGSQVILGTGTNRCHNAGDNTVKTFWPEASVGAGAAGPANHQLVNFSQFGRCLDVTQQQPNSNYMIVWPCKQAPDPDDVRWNQKWTLPPAGGTVGLITTTRNGVTYCLRSPGGTADGQYATLVACPASNPEPALRWRRFENTGDYASSYRIENYGDGLCLAAKDQAAQPPDFHNRGERVAKVVMRQCGISTLQKWNADPDILKPLPLKDVLER